MILLSFPYKNNVVYREFEIVGMSGYVDIAVLKPKTSIPNDVTVLDWAKTKPHTGDNCVVFGNPLSVDEGSISNGIIRDSEFYISNIIESISITAPSLQGNSGGAITNIDGDIIGLVSAGLSDYETITWGATYTIVKRIVEKIITTNSNYRAGTLNVKLRFPDALDANTLNLESLQGFIVSSSENPLLKDDDVITKINNNEIGYFKNSLSELILLNPNTVVSLNVIRNNQTITIPNVTISELSLSKDTPLGQ